MNGSIKIVCPHCYSPDLVMYMEGMNSTSGGTLTTPAGNVDNNNMELKCRSCGRVFKPGEGKLFQESGSVSQPAYRSTADQFKHPGEPEILNICNTQGKLAAVKYCVLTYGWGLKEAKAYVNSVLGDVAKKPANIPVESPINDREVTSIMQTHGKLNAIKFVRDHSGWSLKQAKDYVDGLSELPGITSGQKKGCFIATACYGDYHAPEVKLLRHYRDQVLQRSTLGRAFIKVYYTFSPPLANILSRSETGKKLVRTYFLVPLLRFIKQDK